MDRVYQYIVKFISDNGYSPTVREIADGVGLASTSSVAGHLFKLEKYGMIRTKEYSPRTIVITGHTPVKKVS